MWLCVSRGPLCTKGQGGSSRVTKVVCGASLVWPTFLSALYEPPGSTCKNGRRASTCLGSPETTVIDLSVSPWVGVPEDVL